jgi:hypothetical protein
LSQRIDVKRITKEDFDSDSQKLIDKLAYPLNSFMEQVQSALDGNINFQNLNREVKKIDVITVSGVPVLTTQYKTDLNTRVLGHNCIAATNNTDASNYPTTSPFINFVQNGSLVRIVYISGLQDNEQYTLVLESIGT